MEQTTETETAYRWAPITQDDIAAWADLVNHLAVIDGTEEFYREAQLVEDLTRTGFDPALDSVAAWDGDTMVAFGSAGVPMTTDHEGSARGYLSGGVREGYRGQGLGRAVMDALEPRAEQLIRERHPDAAHAYVRASGGLAGSSAEQLLEHRGYRIVRYYNELSRGLDDQVEVPEVEGVELVSPTGEHEESTRLAHNDAFRDHWGSGPQAAEGWHDFWTGSGTRPQLSTLAIEDGQVLAYVLCSEYADRELYVDILGTVREGRGRGIARAALLRTIDLAARSGDYDVIELGVDSQNPSGATRLYEKVGFRHKLQQTSMQRDLS